jgi:hypothetical protein
MPLEPVARHGLFFDLCIETQLAPILQPGDVIILCNLSSHKSQKAVARPRRRSDTLS